MAQVECTIAECTVAQTGTCLQENSPEECPNRTLLKSAEAPNLSLDPPLKENPTHVRLPHSLALDPSEVRELMAGRYCRLIGILGLPQSGKTAALVSMYLLLGKSKLDGFEFRDSRSLRAFDEISRGARVWRAGQPFQHMTTHTELSDARTPGFMHLRLRRIDEGRVYDFLLPDLPGEWSQELIDQDRSDRFEFLEAADALWIFIDGEELRRSRMLVVHRVSLLLNRLADLLHRRPKVSFVITKCDHGAPEANAIEALKDACKSFGFEIEIAEIASFKEGNYQDPGFGIAELLSSAIAPPKAHSDFWPDRPKKCERAMLNYREIV